MFDRFVERRLLARGGDAMRVTASGKAVFSPRPASISTRSTAAGVRCAGPVSIGAKRRSHLGGALGGAIFDRIIALGWAVWRSAYPDRALSRRR